MLRLIIIVVVAALAVLLAAAFVGWWILPLSLVGAVAFSVWFGRTLLPSWREKYEWWEPKGALGRAAHAVSTFFVSLWFAGALLARSTVGRALVVWLLVMLIVDYVWVGTYREPVAPPIVGWTGLAVLAGVYGYVELRHQRRWEELVLKAHRGLKGQRLSEDVPVKFRGRLTGAMDYSFGVPPGITRADLFEEEERLRQRVPTHRADLLSWVAKKYPKNAKMLDKAREDQQHQRDRTWRYTWDLEEHRAFAEVVPGIPRRVDHPAATGRLGTIERPLGDPYRIPLGVSVDGTEYWDVKDLYGGLLVAGQIGGGKSVLLRGLIIYALLHSRAWDIYLIDPKVTEFSLYRDFPQVAKVATELRDMEATLRAAWQEMERRYALLGEAKVQKIAELNERRAARGEPPMKRLLVIADEVAELVEASKMKDEQSKADDELRMAAKRHIDSLVRKGRAAGVHVVLATQRPDAEFISGATKSNLQARVAAGGLSRTASDMTLESPAAAELPGIPGRGVWYQSQRLKQMQIYWTPSEATYAVAGVQPPRAGKRDDEEDAA